MGKLENDAIAEAEGVTERDHSAPTTDTFDDFGREMSELLRAARQTADAERARARAEADVIVADAETEASHIRDTARAEAAAEISAAARVREAAEQAASEAEGRAAAVRADLDAEENRVTELVTAERASARTALEQVIDGLRSALGRLDPEQPQSSQAAAIADEHSAQEASPTVIDGLPGATLPTATQHDAESDDAVLTNTVRSAIAMAFRTKDNASR